MATYLLDTNALQGIGFNDLRAARDAGHDLLASPISFWELVCHLNSTNFRQSQANALKLSVCQVLDDPLAEIAADLGCPQAANTSRFEDRLAIPLLLSELQQASSYEDFRGHNVAVDGTNRRVGDIATKAQSHLSAEEDRFVGIIRNTRDNIRTRYNRNGGLELAGVEFCRESLGFAQGLEQDFTAAGCEVTFAAIANRTVLGAGYAVARALHYARLSDRATIDRNDLEDYFISLHLGAASGRVMVTNDSGTRDAIRFVLGEFHQCGAQLGDDFTTSVGLIDCDAFLSETRINLAH